MKTIFSSIIYTLFFLILLVTKSFSQTNVSGGIYSNTTWTLANSPYIVTDTVVLFPGVTLMIEPGVVVRFNPDTRLDIRQSTLIASGTSVDSITFTSNLPSPAIGDYAGLYLMSAVSPVFNYCNFYYANVALTGNSYDSISIMNSKFENNNTGIEHLNALASMSKIQNSSFRHNQVAAFVSSFRAENCTFSQNQTGISYCEFTTLQNCFIDSNSVTGIEIYQGDSVLNNRISFNNVGILLVSSGTPSLITGNIIDYNNIGIELNGSYYSTIIYCNKICNNISYDAKNSISANVNIFENNFWCLTDSALISGNIYDGYDNSSVGLIDFIPYDTTGCFTTGCNLLLHTSVINANCDTCHSGSATVTVSNAYPPVTYTWNSSPIQTTNFANGLSPGSYSVCVSDGNGCTACTQVYIDSTNCTGFSVNAQATNATCSLCNDGSALAAVIGGTNPYNYTWYTSPVQTSDSITGLAQGSYAVCVTDLYGCSACDTAVIGIGNCSAHFNLYPDTVPHQYFAVNMTSGVSPFTYDWNWGDGSQNDTGAYPSHLYAAAGYYTICLTITDSSGCINTYCNSFYLLRTTGTNSMISVNVIPALVTGTKSLKNSKGTLEIFPNPAYDILNILTGSLTANSPSEIFIYNSTGEKIISKKFMADNSEVKIILDVHELKPGIYYVVLQNGKEIVKKSFCK